MKKILVGAVAALIATTALSTTADAGQRWKRGWHNGHHHGWHHKRAWKRHAGWRHGRWHHRHAGWRAGVWIGGPRIVIGSGCYVKKHVNRHGVVVKKRYC
jgi:Ni/Co efflux regulator RcnB